MDLRRCRTRISSRICAWVVTSSAVVGSSAISTSGSSASAMAIITRWRCPPERRNGYCSAMTGGSGRPTSPRSARILAWRFALSVQPWATSTSSICAPTVISGFRAESGSWKIIASDLPRRDRRSASGMARRSRP